MGDFMTVEQVASLLQVSKRTVLNLINRGRFPGAAKIDPLSLRSTWRIPNQDLKAYQQKRGIKDTELV